jgi:predicted GTPase
MEFSADIDNLSNKLTEDLEILNFSKVNESLPNVVDSAIKSKGKDVILVVGVTGSGKSTLVNGLIGRALKYKIHKGKLRLVDENEISNSPKIGHGNDSETSIIRLYSKNNSSIVYADCAGFGENRGEEQEVLNFINTNSMVKNAKSIKMLFVISDAELEAGRGDLFVKLSETISSILKNTNDAKKSMNFVITKDQLTEMDATYADVSKTRVTDKITDMIKKSNEKLEELKNRTIIDPDEISKMEKQIEVLELMSNQDRIFISTLAKKPVKFKADLIKSINSSTPIKKTNINFGQYSKVSTKFFETMNNILKSSKELKKIKEKLLVKKPTFESTITQYTTSISNINEKIAALQAKIVTYSSDQYIESEKSRLKIIMDDLCNKLDKTREKGRDDEYKYRIEEEKKTGLDKVSIDLNIIQFFTKQLKNKSLNFFYGSNRPIPNHHPIKNLEKKISDDHYSICIPKIGHSSWLLMLEKDYKNKWNILYQSIQGNIKETSLKNKEECNSLSNQIISYSTQIDKLNKDLAHVKPIENILNSKKTILSEYMEKLRTNELELDITNKNIKIISDIEKNEILKSVYEISKITSEDII